MKCLKTLLCLSCFPGEITNTMLLPFTWFRSQSSCCVVLPKDNFKRACYTPKATNVGEMTYDTSDTIPVVLKDICNEQVLSSFCMSFAGVIGKRSRQLWMPNPIFFDFSATMKILLLQASTEFCRTNFQFEIQVKYFFKTVITLLIWNVKTDLALGSESSFPYQSHLLASFL